MIYELLMSNKELSVDYLELNKKEIFETIPELKNEESFDQKSNWHIYDVWKHTEVALSYSNYDFEERLALLLHDVGKPFSYQDDGEIRHFKGHADKSAEISAHILERLGYDTRTINRILFLIKNHSTTIDFNNVNGGNIELYQKLLNIQYCDTRAYNPEKIAPVIKRLDEIREKINKFQTEFSKDENEER